MSLLPQFCRALRLPDAGKTPGPERASKLAGHRASDPTSRGSVLFWASALPLQFPFIGWQGTQAFPFGVKEGRGCMVDGEDIAEMGEGTQTGNETQSEKMSPPWSQFLPRLIMLLAKAP